MLSGVNTRWQDPSAAGGGYQGGRSLAKPRDHISELYAYGSGVEFVHESRHGGHVILNRNIASGGGGEERSRCRTQKVMILQNYSTRQYYCGKHYRACSTLLEQGVHRHNRYA